MQTKDGPHVPPPAPWGRPHDPDALAPRCAEIRARAATLAALPVLPREREAFAQEFAARGRSAAQALAGSAVPLERPGDGPERPVPAAPGPAGRGGGSGGLDWDAFTGQEWERLAAWDAGPGGGGPDGSVLAVLRRALGAGAGGGHGPGPGRDAPVAGGDPDDRAQKDRAVSLIAAFAAWFDGPGLAGEAPAVRAALAHYHILSLRPLSEAYPVAARLAESAVLRAAGHLFESCLMPEYYLRHASEYEALAPVHPALCPAGGAAGDDPTRFVAFCLDGLIWGGRVVAERIAEGLRRLVLERHYEELRQARQVTARQHALLQLLLDAQAPPVGIRSLCRVSPFRLLYGRASEQTARRDLQRLMGMGLLASSPGGFVLNRHVLCGAGGV